MRVFVAGGAGALGKRLIPLLVRNGHEVAATTRTTARAGELRALGAEPVIMDALSREAVMKAVLAARPEVVVHQMTALAGLSNLKKFDVEFALTNRLRTEGTDYLLAAAQSAGARRFIAQSYTGWPNQRTGGRVKSEDEPLDSNPPKMMTRSFAAIQHLETVATTAPAMTGIVLRYGSFYGPGTSLGADGIITNLIRQRKFPLVGDGAGVWSFIHIDDAATATQRAIEGGPQGIYNIVDDEPADVSIWLPEFAKILGAPPPRRFPIWLARLAIGDPGVAMMTQVRGSSNAKAKRLLHWQLHHASWREGFRAMLVRAAAAT